MLKTVTFTLMHFCIAFSVTYAPVSYTHLRAHETRGNLVCRLLLEKKNMPSSA